MKSVTITIRHENSSKPDTKLKVPQVSGHILHVKAGIRNVWDPTDEEMDTLAALFLQALEDPKGGIVVTREGVTAKVLKLE